MIQLYKIKRREAEHELERKNNSRPILRPEDIKAAIAYAAELSRERLVSVTA